MPGGLYQIKSDPVQLDFNALFINPSHFKSHTFFKVFNYDYSKFDTKITICCLGHIKIQFKKTNKEETLKNSSTESLAPGFWVSYRSLLHFKKLILG